jgi:dephospho-CoA kinase
LGPDGCVNRKLLGARVFGKPAELAALEGIVHPAVDRETIRWIQETRGRPRAINAALLHRSSVFEKLDCVILVKAPFLIRLLRARARDRLSWGALFKRFASQREFNAQYFKNNTDIYTVYNNGFSVCGVPFFRGRPERRMRKILSGILNF